MNAVQVGELYVLVAAEFIFSAIAICLALLFALMDTTFLCVMATHSSR